MGAHACLQGAGSGLAGWQIQVQACLEEYTRNLVPRVSLLTTGQLSSVLYALSRAGYRDGRIGQTAMQVGGEAALQPGTLCRRGPGLHRQGA